VPRYSDFLCDVICEGWLFLKAKVFQVNLADLLVGIVKVCQYIRQIPHQFFQIFTVKFFARRFILAILYIVNVCGNVFRARISVPFSVFPFFVDDILDNPLYLRR